MGAAYGWEGGGKNAPPLPKTCHTYPTTIKRGTVIPYLKEIQKIYESRDNPLSFADISIFHCKSANFVMWGNTDTDCVFVHNL